MSNEIKEKEEYEKYARDHRKELDAQEVKLGDVVKVLVGHFAGEKGVIVGMIACDKSDYADPYYEIEMECDVPEEFRVRKTLIGQSRVIGGVERRYLKVIGNRAPKQPSMEIKQGDKVRVSKDAPKMYMCEDSILPLLECEVLEVETDNARIEPKDPDGYLFKPLIIPTKYLVKVEDESKESKFKAGDRVRIKGCGYEPNLHKGDIGEILDTNDKEQCFVLFKKSQAWIYADCLEPYTEPTEQTEAEKKPNVGSIKIPVEVDLTDSYWDAYAADLAKEVALKVANKYTDPKETAEYAVSVAKAVVEGLKGK